MDTKVKRIAAIIGGVIGIVTGSVLIARKVVTLDDLLDDPPMSAAAMEQRLEGIVVELRGHHDTIIGFSDVHHHISGIEEAIVELAAIQLELREAQEEYQDSAIAQRNRRYCAENPGAC